MEHQIWISDTALMSMKETYLGKRKSSRRSRPSPYPNFRSTVHVVSIRPCWINIVCRYKNPISVMPSAAGESIGGGD
jgi:hypothetical protein